MLCGKRLTVQSRGEDHRGAVALSAGLDREASRLLEMLLSMKTRAGYGHDPISEAKLRAARRAAQQLVEGAGM